MDGRINTSKPAPASSGSRALSKPDGYKSDLKQVESYAGEFDLDTVEKIYTKLLNDESLGDDAQADINAHLVETYKQYGDVYYERQLTTLFQNLNAAVKPLHKKINSELATKFSHFGSSHENNQTQGNGYKPLSIYGAHLHIASTLGDATSSLFLKKLHIFEREDEAPVFDCALKTVGAWCEQSSAMKGSARNFNWAAQSIPVPNPKPVEILPKEMAKDDPGFLQFGTVDNHLAGNKLTQAENVLKEIAEEHLGGQEAQKLFSEQPSISSNVRDWYCDHGPIYTRIALKLAKIRWRDVELLSVLTDADVVQVKKKKVYELVQVVNSIGSSEINKAIKLELGEWYLTRATLGFVGSDEKAKAKNLLEELNLKKIPNKYPEMQRLSAQIVRK